MVYSHCTGTEPGQVQVHGTGPVKWEAMDPGPFIWDQCEHFCAQESPPA